MVFANSATFITKPQASQVKEVTAPLDGNDGDSVLVRQLDHFLAVEHQSFTGGETETGGAGVDHGFNRRDADYRDIEAHVLIGLGDLDDGEPAAHQPARAANHGVGPFHRFNCDAGAIANHNRLPQIESRDLLRNLQTVFDVAALAFVGCTPGQSS